MKALTLTEPYATLVLNGWKRYETRSWQTRYRGPLAIHAAATFNGVGGKREFEQIMRDLHPELLARLTFGAPTPLQFPLGSIIGVTWLEECVPVEDVRDEIDQTDKEFDWWEGEVGNYRDGRYAWKLRDPVAFQPFKWKGHQGLWDVPDEVIPEFARRAIAHPA